MAEPDRHDQTEVTGEDREPVVEVTGEPPPDGPSWPRGARLLTAAAIVVLALGALAVTVTLANPDRLGVAFSGGRGAPTSTGEPGGAGAAEAEQAAEEAQAAAEESLTAPVAGRRRATFELVDGVSAFRLRTGELGDELYRITSPGDSGVVPRPEVLGDRVRLHLDGSGRSGAGSVDVVLNSRLVWRLRLVGGVSAHQLDLRQARLAGVDMVGGASRIDLSLPPTAGTLTVRMTGGVSQFTIRAPGTPPVRVRAASGAGGVTVYDDRHDGLAVGETVSSPNWDRAVDRIYVDLVGGANRVTIGAE
ncbi:hypothetical protein FHX75_111634 [Micromonospora palomenae]|uniref:Uncharacterized protein n=1 Tax=Micromonospora palomenae TaxID=1461247 RepID=A0A561WX72_9ACTN|nr:hypothetical protein [Micromonospora palomenae]TWG28482.1 hypothetical protein FHX75_111634 [Micromonospora palomenae]